MKQPKKSPTSVLGSGKVKPETTSSETSKKSTPYKILSKKELKELGLDRGSELIISMK